MILFLNETAVLETEQEGFEPPVPFGTVVFKTTALSRSATAPGRGHHAHFESLFYATDRNLQVLGAQRVDNDSAGDSFSFEDKLLWLTKHSMYNIICLA